MQTQECSETTVCLLSQRWWWSIFLWGFTAMINCALSCIFSFSNCLQSEKYRFRQILCSWPVIPLGNTINTGSVNYSSESTSSWQIWWQYTVQQIHNMNNALTNEKKNQMHKIMRNIVGICALNWMTKLQLKFLTTTNRRMLHPIVVVVWSSSVYSYNCWSTALGLIRNFLPGNEAKKFQWVLAYHIVLLLSQI